MTPLQIAALRQLVFDLHQTGWLLNKLLVWLIDQSEELTTEVFILLSTNNSHGFEGYEVLGMTPDFKQYYQANLDLYMRLSGSGFCFKTDYGSAEFVLALVRENSRALDTAKKVVPARPLVEDVTPDVSVAACGSA